MAKIVLFCRFVYNGKYKNEQVLWDCCIDEGEAYEKIYEETDSLKIARAFRKAGRSLRNE